MAQRPGTIKRNELSYDAIVRTLFENYESIYDIDAETFAYQCYHESDSYSELKIDSSGEDFFGTLYENIQKMIHPDDWEYVSMMLQPERMLQGIKKDKYYTFVYRLMMDGVPVYHKIRATIEIVDGRRHILLGVRNVDETIRQEQAHTDALASMCQKEKNHMEAILASASAYLEVNLTQDLVLDRSSYHTSDGETLPFKVPDFSSPLRYSDFNDWMCREQIARGVERYRRISDREYLIRCFDRGEKRASVSFTARISDNELQPCKEVFYLYRDDASGDIMAFCVVYDLTEQQRMDKEVRELENALRLSRIRNFTSQMQPHFLYNALGSIQEIILDDPEYASALIGDFTIHLRSCIRAMSSDSPLPFDQELANIRAYVNIEKMRFGKKLKVVFDTPVTEFEILPLSIQPLVENAIRHGIYERGVRGGTVTIRTRDGGDNWVVEVEDDGVGFDTEQLKREMASGARDSTGLDNITFRLDKVMHASVDIKSTAGTGTKVTVTIPKGGDIE